MERRWLACVRGTVVYRAGMSRIMTVNVELAQPAGWSADRTTNGPRTDHERTRAGL